ncbi:MAG: hemerythrin family protein [Magnetococcales bacterium]|nr:hemerythrin family protein [Magnetococcales bacterium]
MDLVSWKQNYTTGNEDIDAQHRYFANLINRINHELLKPSDVSYQTKLLQELHSYSQFHFLSEENIMYKLGVSNLEEHKTMHILLSDTLNDMISRIESKQILPLQILQFLTNWFVSHTTEEDLKNFSVR